MIVRRIPVFLVVVLAILGVYVGPAQSAFPGANGKIAFVSAENGDAAIHIYSVNADSTEPTKLTDSAGFDRAPVWSPDGRRIAFTRDHESLVVMEADGSNVTTLASQPAGIRDPAWSPGGNWLVFVGPGDDPGSSSHELYRINADGTGQINLTRNDELHEGEPAWSPDGSRIAFTGHNFPLLNQQVFVMNAGGGDPLNLTGTGPSSNHQPAWSPAGDKIAFVSDRDGNDEIYLMNADGTGVQRLTNDAASDSAPAWSPDGTQIVFESSRVSPAELYVRDATPGGPETRLTTRPNAGAVSPDWQPLAGSFGRLTLALEITPASDPNRFDLSANASVLRAAAGDGDSFTTSVPPGPYGLGVTPALDWTLLAYTTSISCTKNGSPYVPAAGTASVDVEAGELVTCTIRLVRLGHTPAGTNVAVAPFDSTTGGTPVRIRFGTVTSPGLTTLQTGSSGPPPPSGFVVSGVYYELSTAAAFDEAEVCFAIVPPSAPTIAHWLGQPPVVSTPTTYYKDAAGAVVMAGNGVFACAIVTSFSPFALLVPTGGEDLQAPVISCGSPDAVWHDANVSIACTAEDSGSGLADPAAAAFSLSTSVPAGTENGDAMTGSRQVCDVAGNCATAGPIGGNKVDRKAPALLLPANRTVDATSPVGATVSFSASATDGADPDPGVTCSPASGSVFPIGTSAVACTATDHVGNEATGSFTVTVLGAKEQLSRLVQKVLDASTMPPALQTTLTAQLQSLVAGFDPGNAAQRRVVCLALKAFALVVQTQSGRGIPAVQAAEWIADANRIRAVLGC